VDVLRRTRRNADTISGAVPAVTSGRPAAVRVGARPYQRIAVVGSNRQIHGPLHRNAFYLTAQRLPRVRLTIILGSSHSQKADPNLSSLPLLPHAQIHLWRSM
jgi:hypothetical protein